MFCYNFYILYILINDLDYAIVVSKDKICLVLVNQKQDIIMAAICFASSRRIEVITMWTVNDDDGREANNGRNVMTKLHLVTKTKQILSFETTKA
jgi:hypothetical protein